MRLKSIKLAGFKSFVEPTTVSFPGNMCAIVGPNGCGKSNVIDAVRWVMGESSASKLRGEAITDVIFSGSNTRKPTNMASIELCFDNSDGRIGGEYAQYADIVIRRQVTRDSQSTYFLNGQRCRRRDIQDVFLGTGFGPRSYSIIEQGMISQLVEAKPEELRHYLEEAAGISKYKERRRETETRIRHTRENLERLGDLREELDRQLAHLKRQARAAERFRELKADEHTRRAELLTLRWQSLGKTISANERRRAELVNAVERCVADQRSAGADIESHRAQHAQCSERLNGVQGRFYEAGARIARLEEAIRSRGQRIARLEQDLAGTTAELERIVSQAEQDATARAEVDRNETEIGPEIERLAAADQSSAAALDTAESDLGHWRARWEAFNGRFADIHREVDVEDNRAEHLRALLQRLQARLAVLDGEQGAGDTEPLTDRLAELRQSIGGEEAGMQQARQALEAGVADRDRLRAELDAGQARRETLRAEVEQLAQESASLQAEQRVALGQVDDPALPWLQEQGLDGAPRLAERLKVTSGWERAAEVVLDSWLKAVVCDVEPAQLASVAERRVELISSRVAGGGGGTGADSLATHVSADVSIGSLLAGVRCVPDLDTALAARAQLAPGESVVTPEGAWIGPDWMRIGGAAQARSGVIARGRRIEELATELDGQRAQLADVSAQVDSQRAERAAATVRRDNAQQQVASHGERLGLLRADIGRIEVRLQEAQARRARAAEEAAELTSQVAEENTRLAECEARQRAAAAARDALSGDRDVLLAERSRLEAAVATCREQRDASRAQLASRQLEQQRLHTRRTSLVEAEQRLAQQRAAIDERRTGLEAALAVEREPEADERGQLTELLEARAGVEEELRVARVELETCEGALAEAERARDAAEQAVEAARAALSEHELASREVQVRRAGLMEQLREQDSDPEVVAASLPDEATDAAWSEQLEKIGHRIQRLGAINLAAIDEFDTASERKVYLDSQSADLEAALETLESAIRRIDKETRNRFRETFDAVNGKFRELFPRVFGGGDAYLELTGEDVLDAGVALMARPPGKRNSHIHLLSGGEKALTAMALVFAIFHLNPSPVCMLDEVDAPLDDVNVGRYAQLIKDMSGDVQFVFITHNKLSMEMADQLCGVTMAEAGVSRLVTVDIEEAAAMAAV